MNPHICRSRSSHSNRFRRPARLGVFRRAFLLLCSIQLVAIAPVVAVDLTISKSFEILAAAPRPLDAQTNWFLHSVVPTRDGGFLVIGSHDEFSYLLMRFESSGRAVSSLTLSNSSLGTGRRIGSDTFLIAEDGSLLFLARGNSSIRDSLVRVASDGSVVSELPLGLVHTRIVQTRDGYLIGGTEPSTGPVVFTKYTTNGLATNWRAPGPLDSWPVSGGPEYQSILPDRNGSFVFAGSGMRRLTKIDSNGVVAWDSKAFGNGSSLPTLVQYLVAILPTRDGGYLLAGTDLVVSPVNQAANADYLLVKTSSSGVPQWIRRFGGSRSESLRDVMQTDDGGFLLVGHSESEEPSGNKSVAGSGVWVIKTNERGLKETESLHSGLAYGLDVRLVRTPAGFALITNQNGNTRISRVDLNVVHRAKVFTRNPSGLPYAVEVSNDLIDWTPIVTGYSGDLELQEITKNDRRFWRAFHPE